MIIIRWGVVKQILTALTCAMVKTPTPSVIPAPFNLKKKKNARGITSEVVVLTIALEAVNILAQ